ncbi:uncharacterized mitochondrial protein AtMg00810-like [Rutidosis leptorrhynchoides]|uniref:uncharacterized mitochondrial protein AtMg00810-like n=1 Tax=Rutidosis leptorrhynchoides TaxID=125765 RepID=UPI003A99AD62
MLVQVYVDDIIFGSTDQAMVDEFEKVMQRKFKMSSMGTIKFFLGLQVPQTDKGIFLHQTKYVANILKCFQADTDRPTKTPLSVNYGISPDCEGAKVDHTLYRAIIGSLMYLIVSRPDIMFADGFELTAYSDSDYGGCKKDFKSTSEGCQFLGSKLVTWQFVTKNPVNYSKMKHIGIKYHFIRDCYEKKLIDVVQLDITTQRADLFTKAFDKPRFDYLLKEIGIKVLKDVVSETEVPNTEEPDKEIKE